MNIAFNTGSIALFCLISQGFFASVLLVLKKENREANRYLALLIFFMSLWLCDSFFRTSGVFQQNPDFYFLPIYFSLGFGPLIYFYTKSLVRGSHSLSFGYLLHFIPVLFQFFFYVYLQSRNYSFRRTFWLNVHSPFLYDLELILSFISMVFYLYAGRKEILWYKQELKNSFSNIHKLTLNWLNMLHVLLAILALFWGIEAIIRLSLEYYAITPLSAITIGFAILLMAGGGILQKDLGEVTKSMQIIHGVMEVKNGPIEVDPAVIDQLQRTMSKQKLFLRQELTLKEFASEVGMPPREVSRSINQGLGMSFIDFVNGYRVRKCKELITENKLHYLSLAGIAFESGFNSKSTFNRVFKKMEGKSPSEYQKEVQNTY